MAGTKGKAPVVRRKRKTGSAGGNTGKKPTAKAAKAKNTRSKKIAGVLTKNWKCAEAGLAFERAKVKCEKCKANEGAVHEYCLEKQRAKNANKPAQKKTPAAKGRAVKAGNTAKKTKRVVKPWACAIDGWLAGQNRQELIAALIEKGMKPGPAKNFARDVNSVGMASVGRARKKGGLIEQYVNWAMYGIGSEPTGCKVTLGFCRAFCVEAKKLENAY